MPPERLPCLIHNEAAAVVRKAAYSRGGVVLVSSRVLVMDLLTRRLPATAISGFLICNAHTVTEHGPESFILRIHRRFGPHYSAACVRCGNCAISSYC